MKILFSPSETKNSGGTTQAFCKNSFIFPELFEKRMQIVNQYNNYILNGSKEQLIKLFGTKKDDVINQDARLEVLAAFLDVRLDHHADDALLAL